MGRSAISRPPTSAAIRVSRSRNSSAPVRRLPPRDEPTSWREPNSCVARRAWRASTSTIAPASRHWRATRPAAERAYAAYLAGKAQGRRRSACCPTHHRAVAAGDGSALAAIDDPLSRLVAAGVLFREGRDHTGGDRNRRRDRVGARLAAPAHRVARCPGAARGGGGGRDAAAAIRRRIGLAPARRTIARRAPRYQRQLPSPISFASSGTTASSPRSL